MAKSSVHELGICIPRLIHT